MITIIDIVIIGDSSKLFSVPSGEDTTKNLGFKTQMNTFFYYQDNGITLNFEVSFSFEKAGYLVYIL